MGKRFNVTGLCVPQKHYMVDLADRLAQVRKMVDDGAYFTIHRARQYGKTTLIHGLESYLKTDYLVISMDLSVFVKRFPESLLFIRFRGFCLQNIFGYLLTEKAETKGRNGVTLLPFYL